MKKAIFFFVLHEELKTEENATSSHLHWRQTGLKSLGAPLYIILGRGTKICAPICITLGRGRKSLGTHAPRAPPSLAALLILV